MLRLLKKIEMLPYCQSLNREISLEKRRENSLLLRNIKVMADAETGSKFLCVTYPLSCDPEVAYHPAKSNYVQARHNAIRLRKRLIKQNLLESFDRQLRADIDSGFCEIIQGSQVADILAQVHCCSTINYVLKPSSESTPLRLVTNASFFHQSKSLNQNVIPGLTELPPIHHLLLEFFLSPWVACFDISKCYRAIHTSEATNLLRIIPIWADESDAECSALLKYSRMCFGDVAASSILLLSYFHFVLPLLKSPLARKALSS